MPSLSACVRVGAAQVALDLLHSHIRIASPCHSPDRPAPRPARLCRAQNDFDFAQRQEGIGDLERLRLAAEAAKEASKEEQFHLKQSIERARKRLDEARAQPIDELVRALHLQASHAVAGGEWRPQHVLQGMRVEEAQALLEPVQLLKVRALQLRCGLLARLGARSGHTAEH